MQKVDVLNLDGRQLQIFLAVFDTQSVTRAAEALGLSQPAVSHALDRLRLVLRDPLFVKQGRGIAPTSYAGDLAPRVRTLLADFQGLSFDRAYEPADDRGTLTLAANLTEMLPLLLQIAKAIRSQAPHILVRMIELGSPMAATTLLDHDGADLVLTLRHVPVPSHINHTKLYTTHHLCYFDPAQTDPPDTLDRFLAAGHGVLDFGRDGQSIVDRALNNKGFTRTVALSASNSHVLAALMRGTPFVATLPEPLARTSFLGFAAVAPPKELDLAHVTCSMLWSRRTEHSGKHQWLADLVREVATEF